MGPAAIAGDTCRLDAPRESGWRVSLATGLLDTRLDFGDLEAGLRQLSVNAGVSLRASKGLALHASAGLLAGGELAPPGATLRLEPGFVGSVGATVIALDGRGARPFVTLSVTVSHARTHDSAGAPYRATDLSLGAAVGRAFGGWIAPYLAAKVFGGPVSWEHAGQALTGTDVHHYGVGAGAAAALPGGFDLFLEGVFLGARGATLSLGRPL